MMIYFVLNFPGGLRRNAHAARKDVARAGLQTPSEVGRRTRQEFSPNPVINSLSRGDAFPASKSPGKRI